MKFRAFAINIAAIIIAILFISNPVSIIEQEFDVYKVVIDPGHGGFYHPDRKKHGDRYDKITKTYLSDFAPGAEYRGYEEHELMYEIGKKVYDILELTRTPEGFRQFRKIALKFTNKPPRRVIIDSVIIREDSRNRKEILSQEDPNAKFRLFDYPDKKGQIQPGRLSKINAEKPQLVVSLHCDYYAPKDHRSFAAIVVPPYEFIKKGIWFYEDRSRSINYFRKSPYNSWFMESGARTAFQWYMSDVSSYFTGFSLNKDYTYDFSSFSGLRYNMVKWKYADQPDWVKYYNDENEKQYIRTLDEFSEFGSFWRREKSVYEKYRRDGGYEGHGGDNNFASTELLRYILTSLKLSGKDHRLHTIGDPYYCIWTVPLHVNAINAFIEIGYVRNKHFQKVLTKDQQDIAEGIAVGIYSMFTGLEVKNIDYKYKPKGKKIDLEKYMISDNLSYFDIVAGDENNNEN